MTGMGEPNEAPPADADAIYLPGGYPELHATAIAGNAAFLDGLRRAAAAGKDPGGPPQPPGRGRGGRRWLAHRGRRLGLVAAQPASLASTASE